ncbi:DUF481 domain-containing protein [Thalassotalea aquiviva]|uniref:DUF481 domain-containing protein n=1 Tax=Thalassotalea aquiviva TaxID=3242415 RepID=UPI00352BA079
MQNTIYAKPKLMALAFLLLFSINPLLFAQESSASKWQSDISAGLNYKDGNSERTDYTMSASTERKTENDRFSAKYLGIFAKVTDTATDESEVTERNHRLNAAYDLDYSERVFFRLPSFEYFTDTFKNISHQATLGVAVGYKIYDQPDFRWDVLAGPSMQYTKYDEVEAGEDDTVSTPVLLIGTQLEYLISEDIKYFLLYEGKFVKEDAGKRIDHLETGFNISLIGNLSLDAKLVVDRVDYPIPDEDGVLPEKTDKLFILAAKYSF